MTAIVIFLIFGAITMVIWQGAIDVAAGRMTRRHDRRLRALRRPARRRVRRLSEVYGDLLRAAGASERLAELLDAEPDIRAPAKPGAAARAAARRARRSSTSPSTIRRGRDTSALERFQPARRRRASGWRWSARRARARRPSSSSPSASTIRRQGRVLLDGVDLRDADPADVRQRIAMVPQETVIFAASARDNLRYGNWDASEDELWQAARDANAEEFLRALPEGLDTFMGEGGARLSGGQRQRIAIARALLRDAPLLLLDEATSALDAESERLVQDALDRLMERPHDDRHRAPPRDRARRRPDRRHGRRPDRRGRHARDASTRAAGSTRAWRASSSRTAPPRRSPPAPPPLGRRPPPTAARRCAARACCATARLAARLRRARAASRGAVARLARRRRAAACARVDGLARGRRRLRACCACARRALARRGLRAFAPVLARCDARAACSRWRCLRIAHLPDITRCAASATASAISEPSLVALAIMLVAACDAVSAASRPASRICAARLRAGADRRSRGGETGGEHFLAHRGLGELVDGVVATRRRTRRSLSCGFGHRLISLRLAERHFNAVTVP